MTKREKDLLESVLLTYRLVGVDILETKFSKFGITGTFQEHFPEGKTVESLLFFKLQSEKTENFFRFVERELKTLTGCSSLEEIVLKAESERIR